MADIHMNPEEAVRAHLDVTDSGLECWCQLPFRLAPHLWGEPVERFSRRRLNPSTSR